MPDIKQAQIYQGKILAIEKKYLAEIERKRRELRRALSDILARDGVSRAGVAAMHHEIDALRRALADLARKTAKDIRNTNANYLRKQLDILRRAGHAAPDVTQIVAAASGKAIDGEEAYMTNTSAWVDTLENNLRLNAAALRMSNASRDEQFARLIAEDDEEGDGRASVYAYAGRQAQNEEMRNIWSYAIGLMGAYFWTVNQATDSKIIYKKQAIATIDENTTDCCLQVHGQIRDIDEPFRLTGTPRFADEIQDPPFHWNCRTTEVLYHESFEEFGISTDEMRDAARAELEAREKTKKRVPIYPSHATARRS